MATVHFDCVNAFLVDYGYAVNMCIVYCWCNCCNVVNYNLICVMSVVRKQFIS